MSEILTAYGTGCALAAFLAGFETPHDRASFDDLPRVITLTFAWPIVLVTALGQAFRMFSPKRIAEDEGRPWI